MKDESSIDLRRTCESLLLQLDLLEPGQRFSLEPLTGGVSSDIVLITTDDKKLCVKFARAKLKVDADWYAPVHRNAAEYAWLRVAADAAPGSAVKVYGHSTELNGFAMEYLSGGDVYVWKSRLLSQEPDRGEAKAVGTLLGQIHAASVAPGFDQSPFQNSADFHALRIEPYLLYTATQHEDISPQLKKMANELENNPKVLIHGDVSPKNILFRSTGPVLLDAECATIGDACFDVSFCLNHLILKAVHLPATRETLLNDVLDFWDSYEPLIHWEHSPALQSRISRLLPMLMLARIDGKSPVEYLNTSEQSIVRHLSRQFVITPPDKLPEFVEKIKAYLEC